MVKRTKIVWRWQSFNSLGGAEVHEMIALRESVFVVEQICAYQEADKYDLIAHHLFSRDQEHRLIAYARVLPPGTKHPEPSIGRVIVEPSARGKQLGKQTLKRCIDFCTEYYPRYDVQLSAQTSVVEFYGAEGFVSRGTPYDDAGIQHQDMVRLWS
jgi:ElaA protein